MIDEILLYSDYAIKELRDSEIDFGRKIEVITGMICPRCKGYLEPMDHGEEKKCTHCELKMVLYGNGLRCISDENYIRFRKKWNERYGLEHRK